MRQKDAIKRYDYFEMMEAFENTFFSLDEVNDIESRIDRLAFEYYDENSDRTEIPFNKVIRSFYDDAKVYYAIKYSEKMGYYIRSFVDINCDSPIYIYQNSLKSKLPSVYSRERQERLLNKVIDLRGKVIEDIILINPYIHMEDIVDFSTDKFLDIISGIDDFKFNNDYDEYTRYRNELISHNLRAIMNVARDNIHFFNEEHEVDDFYYYKTLIGTEKFLRKYYSFDSKETPIKYSSFLFSYGKYMILKFGRENNSLLLRNNVFYTKYCMIRKLYNNGLEFSEIAKELNIEEVEVRRLYNYFKPVVSLDTEYEYDEVEEDDTLDLLEFEEMREELLSVLDELSERDRAVMMLRYGLVDGECWTLQKIGDYLGVTRECVRQIQKSMLIYLKDLCSDKKMDLYVR